MILPTDSYHLIDTNTNPPSTYEQLVISINPKNTAAAEILSAAVILYSYAAYICTILYHTGVKYMKQQPCDRAIILGEYILENNATVRAAAAWFGISKSTVHKDVSHRLMELSPSLYKEVSEVLAKNKQERHIRGGMATKRKYELLAAMYNQSKEAMQ